MKTITIVGGGWLGRPLAHYLESIGHHVFVSKTTSEGVEQLKQEHLNAFQLDLSAEVSQVTQQISTTQADIVIGCFPPGFRKGNGEEYADYWKTLADACVNANVGRVVMVSSTTVYPNIAEDMVEEKASLALAQIHEDFSDNAKIMLKAEQHLMDSGLKFAIVRCRRDKVGEW